MMSRAYRQEQLELTFVERFLQLGDVHNVRNHVFRCHGRKVGIDHRLRCTIQRLLLNSNLCERAAHAYA